MSRLRVVLPRIAVSALFIALGVLVMSLPGLLRQRGAGMPTLDPFAALADSGVVAADSLPTDSARVLDALRPVQDPEVELGIVDLGLVEILRVDSAGNVALTLTLTVPECPFGRVIGLRAMAAIKAVPGVHRVEVRFDPSAGWTPDRLSPEAKERFHRLFRRDSDTGR